MTADHSKASFKDRSSLTLTDIIEKGKTNEIGQKIIHHFVSIAVLSAHKHDTEIFQSAFTTSRSYRLDQVQSHNH